MAREILYQFMLKYNMVLTKGDVKELKREVRGFKNMGEVFDEGWLSPKPKSMSKSVHEGVKAVT
jgi:hypothetical protein